MNWVGGARNRLKQNPERKFQRQYFNPRRINGRPLNKPLSPPKVSYKPRPPPIKQSMSRDTGLSQDLIGLHTLKNVHDLNNSGQGTQYRSATRVHMDSARKHPINSNYDIELPMSPSTVPSALELLDVTGDDMSLYGNHPPRVSTMKRTNQNVARQFDPLSDGIGTGYGSEFDVSVIGTDERVLSESVISGLPVPVKRHRPSWNELNSTTESIFPTSKAPSKLFQSFQDTRFKPPSRNDINTARSNDINIAPEYGNPSKRSKASDNSIYHRNSVLDTDTVFPVTSNSNGKATYRDWYSSKGGRGDGESHSSRSSNTHKPDPFRCDAVSTNILDRETPFNSSTSNHRSLDVHILTTFHQMQNKPTNDTSHTHSSNSFDSFCSNTDTIVSRGSTYEERPVLLNINRPNKVHNSSGRLVSKISTALEPLETTPTISINKPHPFSVPDNRNVSTTGPIHALSAFEKMIQSLENEDPTPPTSLPPAPPTSLPLAPPTLPAITVESSLTKKQDIKWMEFVQGESGGQNETIHVSPSVRQIKGSPPQSVHEVLDIQLPCGTANNDYSIADNDTLLDEDILLGIAEDPEIVLSDEEIFTSADAFESFYHNHSIREKKKGREFIDISSESIVSHEGHVQNHKAGNNATEHCVAPLVEIASPPHHDVQSDSLDIEQPVKRIEIHTPIKAPFVTTPITDITTSLLNHTSCTQTDCVDNNSTGTQTVYDTLPSQNSVTLLDATTFTGEDQITAILNSVSTQTDASINITDPIPHSIDSEARANISDSTDPAQAGLLQTFKLNSDRIFDVLSNCNERDSIRNVQNEWMENERLFKELTNDLVYQSLLFKLEH